MRHLGKASLLARILETLPCPTFLVDADVHVLHVNGEAERFRGVAGERSEANPLRIGETLGCANARKEPGGCGSSRECSACVIRESVRRALRGEPVRRALKLMEREDGGERRETYLQVSASPIEHERRKLAVLVVDDVTAEVEREHLAEQLRRSQKMEAVGRLAGGVAHDFNNLLTVIVASLGLAREEVPADGAAVPLIVEAEEAAQRAAALTRQLVAFSRNQILEPRLVELNELVEGLRKTLSRVIGEDVALELDLHPGPLRVLADADQLVRVVLNLVFNARDALAQGGRIVLATREVERGADGGDRGRAGRYAQLAVRDTGSGMPPDVLGRLFEPFFTTKAEGRGTGLGLATCYGIVRQHGGFIDVESAPGLGSTFRVHLPAARPAADGSRRPATDDAPRAGAGMVLLVEDEAPVRRSVRRLLDGLGHRVLEAASGAEALEILDREQGPIDLVVTDVALPGMNGRELADAVRRKRSRTQVLLMSGHVGGHFAAGEALAEGMHFIGEPFALDVLARKIGEVLGGRKAAGEPRSG